MMQGASTFVIHHAIIIGILIKYHKIMQNYTSCDVMSCMPSLFSHHLILHLPSDNVFTDTTSLGALRIPLLLLCTVML